MNHSPGRYSKYLRLINISVHLLLLNFTIWYFDKAIIYNPLHVIFINFSWLIVSYLSNFYNTYRFIDLIKLIERLFIQYIVFFLAYFSFFAAIQESFNLTTHLKIAFVVFVGLMGTRLFFYFSLRAYRRHGGNFRRVVVIGNSKKDKTLQNFFLNRDEFGYKLKGFFSDEHSENLLYKGELDKAFDFILENNIDEIYCSLDDLTKGQIKKFIKFSDDNCKVLKFIPKSETALGSEINLEYYDYIPVLTLRNNPLSKPLEKTFKRIFDILFSLFIIVFILSWLIPILWISVRLESKGSLIFKQEREGLNGKRFYCFKFRSMYLNNTDNISQTKKNDSRITKVGKFIRKTSIDELPQFINVFLGSMSVVGPRPHMISQGNVFKDIVDKYTVRHFVKPGITGLAQIKGCRGEIETKKDIHDRVKYDIFYIENWSFIMDLKIIVLTFFNAVKGEEKAF